MARGMSMFRLSRPSFAAAALFLSVTACKDKGRQAPGPAATQTTSALAPAASAHAPAVPSPIDTGKTAAGVGAVASSKGVISDAIKMSQSSPTGYNGAEGKVVVKEGTLVTTAPIEGNNAGFFVAFEPIEVGSAKQLVLTIKGRIHQKQGWDHYGSIQLRDEDDRKFIAQELCKEGAYGSCARQSVTKPSALRKGTTLKIEFPAGIKTIAGFEVVGIGATSIEEGLTISDIGLQ
jgi:hypothetical protein